MLIIRYTMKRLLILTIILLSFTAYGQDSTVVKNRWFNIGVNFSPDFCYRTLKRNDNSISIETWNEIKNYEDSIEIHKLGYTTGINFGFRINKHISIETGIQYSNKGYKTIPVMIVYDFNEQPELGTMIIKYSYYDIPLRVNFSFLKKRIQIIAGAGIVLNFLQQVNCKIIPKKPTTTFKTETHISHYDYDKSNFSPTVNIGLKYKINNRMSLQAEPTFRYGYFCIDPVSYEATHLWNVGLNIGYYIGL